MAQKNIEQLKVMLEEKSTTSESHQQERLQSIAGMNQIEKYANEVLFIEEISDQFAFNDESNQRQLRTTLTCMLPPRE